MRAAPAERERRNSNKNRKRRHDVVQHCPRAPEPSSHVGGAVQHQHRRMHARSNCKCQGKLERGNTLDVERGDALMLMGSQSSDVSLYFIYFLWVKLGEDKKKVSEVIVTSPHSMNRSKNGARDEIFIISHPKSCIILIIIEKWFLFNLLGICWCADEKARRGSESRGAGALSCFHRHCLKWQYWFPNGKMLL